MPMIAKSGYDVLLWSAEMKAERVVRASNKSSTGYWGKIYNTTIAHFVSSDGMEQRVSRVHREEERCDSEAYACISIRKLAPGLCRPGGSCTVQLDFLTVQCRRLRGCMGNCTPLLKGPVLRNFLGARLGSAETYLNGMVCSSAVQSCTRCGPRTPFLATPKDRDRSVHYLFTRNVLRTESCIFVSYQWGNLTGLEYNQGSVFSIFTDNHRKESPDEILLKSVNTEYPECAFCRNDVYTSHLEDNDLRSR